MRRLIIVGKLIERLLASLNRQLGNWLADPIRGLEISLLMLLLLLTGGTLGYILIEGMSVNDAFYMTIITITTVGFGEVHPLSPGGRIFTSLLIVSGVATATAGVSNIAGIILGSRLWLSIRERRMEEMIEKLEKHYIVCGYGRMGQQIVRDLQNRHQVFIVIEQDEALREELLESNIMHIIGDGTQDETLEEARISHAVGFVAALNSDADNIMTVLSAREINPSLFIVARAAEASSESKLRRAGANRVVSPYLIGGHRMALAMLRPVVHDFMNKIFHIGDHFDMDIGQVSVVEQSPLVGRTIAQTNLRQTRNVNILAVQKADGEIIINPNAQHLIQPGEVLIVIGPPDAIYQVEADLDSSEIQIPPDPDQE